MVENAIYEHPAMNANHAKHENYLTLQQASKLLPGNPHHGTIGRWAKAGVKVGSTIIRLQSLPVGGRLYTTRTWLNEFSAAIHAARMDSQAVKPAASVPEITETNAAMTLREHGV